MAKKQADAPTFPVSELIMNSYEVFRVPRHVAVGAMALAGKSASDRLTADEFKRLVREFLNRPI